MTSVKFEHQHVIEFLMDDKAEHSVTAHRCLLLNAIWYWVGMALIPLLFCDQIVGGRNASIPISALLYFTLMTIVSVMTEIWVAQHTFLGFLLTRNCCENLAGACSLKFTKAAAIMATILSVLARYDTFCDVIL